MRKNSVKNIRVNGEVQKELSQIIRETKDPRIHPLTSVVAVDVAADLKTCKVYLSVMGSDEDRASTKEGIKAASGFIRHELARRLNLRNTPELRFIIDTSIEDAMKMQQLIDSVVGEQ
ncbi:MAG: 30S ribosome-binding factor RbfA [Parasporobacterium sp.]|nr:30S ribosome-binding factor RbfA [Parasporobacterium sp.]